MPGQLSRQGLKSTTHKIKELSDQMLCCRLLRKKDSSISQADRATQYLIFMLTVLLGNPHEGECHLLFKYSIYFSISRIVGP
jgi:hypothetical protein